MPKIIVSKQSNLGSDGKWEVFTGDLTSFMSFDMFKHLDNNGLARIGTVISVGTPIIGLIGRTSKPIADARNFAGYDIDIIDEIERVANERRVDDVYLDMYRKKHEGEYYEASIYAGPEEVGTVTRAWFEPDFYRTGLQIQATAFLEIETN